MLRSLTLPVLYRRSRHFPYTQSQTALGRISGRSPGIEFNHPLRSINELPPQLLRLENFNLIAESQQAFAGVVFKMKAERSPPPAVFIRRVNAFDAREPADDVKPIDRFRMDARRHRIARKFGFEFDGGSMPVRDEVEGFRTDEGPIRHLGLDHARDPVIAYVAV